MTERLIDLIPSRNMKEKIRQSGFKFTDMGLVKLAYELTLSFDERIKNLSDLFVCVTNENAIITIKELLCAEKAKLNYFISQEDNIFYDVVVFERPKMDGEHYAFKTYADSKTFIVNYVNACREKTYTNEDVNIKYEIHKRYFKTYATSNFDFYADVLACCEFGYGGVMKGISLFERELRKCNGVCHKCLQRCAETNLCDLVIKYPKHLKRYDLIKYINYYKEQRYGVFLYSHGAKDSTDYCISLDLDFFDGYDFNNYYDAHVHVDATEGELADINSLSEKHKKLYYALVAYIKNENKRSLK